MFWKSCIEIFLIFADAGDAMTLIALVTSNEGLRNRVVTEMVTFLSRQCNIYVNE